MGSPSPTGSGSSASCGAAVWRTLALGLPADADVVQSALLGTCVPPALLRGLGSRSRGHSVTWAHPYICRLQHGLGLRGRLCLRYSRGR